eukprot:COSAG03_NODE_2608_length_2597_cov_7.244996_6_plen_95_part_00
MQTVRSIATTRARHETRHRRAYTHTNREQRARERGREREGGRGGGGGGERREKERDRERETERDLYSGRMDSFHRKTEAKKAPWLDEPMVWQRY